MADIFLVESCLSENVVLVEKEKEVGTELIRLVKLLNLKEMKIVLNTFIISERVEHVEEEVNWHQTVGEMGFFAISRVGLNSNHSLLLIQYQIKPFCRLKSKYGIK